MERVQFGDVGLWQFERLRKEKSVRHFVTDRQSVAGEAEFTMSLSSTPDRDFVLRNRMRVAEALQIDQSRLFLPSQVHGVNVAEVTRNTDKTQLANTDALITDEPGTAIAVMSADCVPVLLFDPNRCVVAAIHAGWKGTVAKIVEKTLQRMNERFGTHAADVIAAIGPSICQRSYEVGKDVIDAVQQSFPDAAQLLLPRGEKALLDLWKANQLQLEKCGVKRENIEIANLCTLENNRFFFSARKGDSGRFAAGIMLTS